MRTELTDHFIGQSRQTSISLESYSVATGKNSRKDAKMSSKFPMMNILQHVWFLLPLLLLTTLRINGKHSINATQLKFLESESLTAACILVFK